MSANPGDHAAAARAHFAVGDAFALPLVEAGSVDREAVHRTLGPWLVGPELDADELAARAPLLDVRFVEHLDEVALSDPDDPHSFSTDPSSYRVAGIPLHRVGEDATLVCERGAYRVPFLRGATSLALLRRGALPLRAGAVARDGAGYMIAGSDPLASSGLVAGLIADGCRLVAGDGLLARLADRTLLGNAAPFDLSVDLLKNFPGLSRRLSRASVFRGRTWRRIAAGIERLSGGPAGDGLAPRIARALPRAARRRARARIDPRSVYGPDGLVERARLERCFLLEAQRMQLVSVSELSSAAAARRLTNLVLEDLEELFRAHRRQRLSDASLPARWVEQAEARVLDGFEQLLSGVECTLVRHPRGVWQLELVDLIVRRHA